VFILSENRGERPRVFSELYKYKLLNYVDKSKIDSIDSRPKRKLLRALESYLKRLKRSTIT